MLGEAWLYINRDDRRWSNGFRGKDRGWSNPFHRVSVKLGPLHIVRPELSANCWVEVWTFKMWTFRFPTALYCSALDMEAWQRGWMSLKRLIGMCTISKHSLMACRTHFRSWDLMQYSTRTPLFGMSWSSQDLRFACAHWAGLLSLA